MLIMIVLDAKSNVTVEINASSAPKTGVQIFIFACQNRVHLLNLN